MCRTHVAQGYSQRGTSVVPVALQCSASTMPGSAQARSRTAHPGANFRTSLAPVSPPPSTALNRADPRICPQRRPPPGRRRRPRRGRRRRPSRRRRPRPSAPTSSRAACACSRSWPPGGRRRRSSSSRRRRLRSRVEARREARLCTPVRGLNSVRYGCARACASSSGLCGRGSRLGRESFCVAAGSHAPPISKDWRALLLSVAGIGAEVGSARARRRFAYLGEGCCLGRSLYLGGPTPALPNTPSLQHVLFVHLCFINKSGKPKRRFGRRALPGERALRSLTRFHPNPTQTNNTSRNSGAEEPQSRVAA